MLKSYTKQYSGKILVNSLKTKTFVEEIARSIEGIYLGKNITESYCMQEQIIAPSMIQKNVIDIKIRYRTFLFEERVILDVLEKYFGKEPGEDNIENGSYIVYHSDSEDGIECRLFGAVREEHIDISKYSGVMEAWESQHGAKFTLQIPNTKLIEYTKEPAWTILHRKKFYDKELESLAVSLLGRGVVDVLLGRRDTKFIVSEDINKKDKDPEIVCYNLIFKGDSFNVFSCTKSVENFLRFYDFANGQMRAIKARLVVNYSNAKNKQWMLNREGFPPSVLAFHQIEDSRAATCTVIRYFGYILEGK